ncbi:MAG: sigma factor-like helix-turn-helix DNA-binding protein [Gemmatimonadota bacterium]
MYNPDFWEVGLDPVDLDRFPAESSPWWQPGDDDADRDRRGEMLRQVLEPLMDLISTALTARQREALLLYFLRDKTQEEVAQIMGISRRVVSQHLFGICRDGRHVGGAIARIRKLCRKRGLGLPSPGAARGDFPVDTVRPVG